MSIEHINPFIENQNFQQHLQNKQKRLELDGYASEFIHDLSNRAASTGIDIAVIRDGVMLVQQITDTQPPCVDDPHGTCHIRSLSIDHETGHDAAVDLIGLQFLNGNEKLIRPLRTDEGYTVYEFLQLFPDNTIHSVFIRRVESVDAHGRRQVVYNARNDQLGQIDTATEFGASIEQISQIDQLKRLADTALSHMDPFGVGGRIRRSAEITAQRIARMPLARIALHSETLTTDRQES